MKRLLLLVGAVLLTLGPQVFAEKLSGNTLSLEEFQDAAAKLAEAEGTQWLFANAQLGISLLDMDFDGLPEAIFTDDSGMDNRFVYSLLPETEYRGRYQGELPLICLEKGRLKVVAGRTGGELYLTKDGFDGWDTRGRNNRTALRAPASIAVELEKIPGWSPLRTEAVQPVLERCFRELAAAYWHAYGGKLEPLPYEIALAPSEPFQDGDFSAHLLPQFPEPMAAEELEKSLEAFFQSAEWEKILESGGDDSASSIVLADLDLDGIPEICCSYFREMNVVEEVYSIKDRIRLLGEYYGAPPVPYLREDRLLFLAGGHMGGQAYGGTVYQELWLTDQGLESNDLYGNDYWRDYRLPVPETYCNWQVGRHKLLSPESEERYEAEIKRFYETCVSLEDAAAGCELAGWEQEEIQGRVLALAEQYVAGIERLRTVRQ